MSTIEIPAGAVLLTIRQVEELTALKARTIRKYVSAGRFPKPVRCGTHHRSSTGVRWVRSEVMEWVEQLKQSR